jgi:DNA repair protein RAD50
MLKAGKKKKVCTACNRHLDEEEMEVFEAYVSLYAPQPSVSMANVI